MQVKKPLIAATATSALVVAALAGAGSAGAAPSARKAIGKSTPVWLGKAKELGKASSKAPVNFKVYLTPNGGTAAVEAAVKAVSTAGSASYQKFITPVQYHRAFDPTPQTVAKVQAWLGANGLSVKSVGAHNAYVQVSGSVGKAQSAFSTHIASFTHDGKRVQANTKALTVPVAVAGSVLSVTGIDTSVAMKKPAATYPPSSGFYNGRPCSTYYGQLTATYQADYRTKLPLFKGKALPYAVCGYTGPQLRAAYEGTSKLTGKGITVGIVDAYASPTIRQDTRTYALNNGDGGYVAGQYTQSLQTSYTHGEADVCDASGWFGEQTLDVEAVHAMAPDAHIRYYASKSCYDDDFVSILTRLVNQNKVSIVSNSYGEADEYETTGLLAANHQLFLQAALQGISFMFSSGDSGDELASTGIKQTDSSASDPNVTAVGGTATAIDYDGSLKWSTGWGTEKYCLSKDGKTWAQLCPGAPGKPWVPVGYLYGAGGGYSKLWNRPSYQNGVVPAAAPRGRAVPDVAMDADPTTGMLVGQTQTFSDGVHYGEYRIGGTSLASPLFAGMTALLSQNAGKRLGFLNPMIYAQAKSGLFTDVKGAPVDAGNVRVDYANGENEDAGLRYSVRTFDQNSSLTTVTGWDDTTGVGVPKQSWLTSVKKTA